MESEELCFLSYKDVKVAPEEENKKRSCNCELVDYHSLPSYLKDNEYILDYYRAEWPLKQTILSIFSLHNETLNIWTHLMGFFIFLCLTICTGMVMQRDRTEMVASDNIVPSLSYTWCIPQRCSSANDTGHSCLLTSADDNDADANKILSPPPLQPIARWPFFAFMCGAMFCLLTSSACHLLSCHSKLYSYVMLRLDYTGISVLIVTSFYPLVYYSFMCHPFFRNLYISFITVFGIAITLLSLIPIFQTPKYRAVRSGLFFIMGVSGLVPIVHKVIMFSQRPEALLTTGYEIVMGSFYVIGLVVYVTRVPERWIPGKFDLAGHSHQVFHVLVIAGACTHYLGGLVYLRWRQMEGCY